MDAIPIAGFWLIAIWTLFQKKHALMYLFFASMPFGSFAAIPTALTGGLTLTPTPLVAILLIVRELGNTRGVAAALDMALRKRGLLLLFLFWVVAGVVTMFMPRFFAGSVQIVPVRFGDLADTAPLMPTTQNLSQFVYISTSVLTVFVFARMLRSDTMRRHAMGALCLGAALTVLTGLLDFLAQRVGLESVLELFRTASYGLLTNDEILDSKRVVGLMPEASAYGTLSLSFFASLYFFRRAMPAGRLRDRVVPLLIAALVPLIWLSTSSAAYVGIALFGAVAAADWCLRLFAPAGSSHLRRGLMTEFWLAASALCLLLLIVLVMPQVFKPMQDLFDMMVLQKSNSDSYEERGMWTRVSLSALFATHGLGVGLGGTRASNFAVALASNAGFLGAGLYFLFVVQTFVFRRGAPGDVQARALLSAMRWSYLPTFFTSLLIGTTPDFGLFNAFLYGFAAAVAMPARQINEATRRAPGRLLTRASGHVQH